MTVFLAILSAIRSVASAAWDLWTAIPLKIRLCIIALLAAFILGMWAANSGHSLANLACGCRRGEPRPPKTLSYDVVSVPDGSHITVSYGVRHRRQATVALFGVSIPDSVADAARAELTRLAGDSVNLQAAKPSTASGSETYKGESLSQPGESTTTEAIRPPPSIVYAFGAHGNCGLKLVAAGLARNETTQGTWIEAERAARKQGLGIWAKK